MPKRRKVEIVPFEPDKARRTGALCPRSHHLSLDPGDCVCRVLAQCSGARMPTADRRQTEIHVGVVMPPIR